jgi:hypothetical protein
MTTITCLDPKTFNWAARGLVHVPDLLAATRVS